MVLKSRQSRACIHTISPSSALSDPTPRSRARRVAAKAREVYSREAPPINCCEMDDIYLIHPLASAVEFAEMKSKLEMYAVISASCSCLVSEAQI